MSCKRRKLTHVADETSLAAHRPRGHNLGGHTRTLAKKLSGPSPDSHIDDHGSTGATPPDTRIQVADCSICLDTLTNPALAYPCNHEFDFECIRRWNDLSSACPLCKARMQYIIHDVRGNEYRKYVCPVDRSELEGNRSIGEIRRRRREEEQDRRFQRRLSDRRRSNLHCTSKREDEIALSRRKFVYDHKLLASHVGTNQHSNFQAFTAQDVCRNVRNLKRKATMFLRREFKVFPFLEDNVEFMLQYIVEGVLTRLDIQAPGTLKLVGDYVGTDTARVLLHELRTFLRSPYEDLRSFDRSMLIQYGRTLEPSWPDRALAK